MVYDSRETGVAGGTIAVPVLAAEQTDSFIDLLGLHVLFSQLKRREAFTAHCPQVQQQKCWRTPDVSQTHHYFCHFYILSYHFHHHQYHDLHKIIGTFNTWTKPVVSSLHYHDYYHLHHYHHNCSHRQNLQHTLTLNFLVEVVNTINTKTHSSNEMAEFCFENADAKSICYSKQRVKNKLSHSSKCVKMKLCKLCTSFI